MHSGHQTHLDLLYTRQSTEYLFSAGITTEDIWTLVRRIDGFGFLDKCNTVIAKIEEIELVMDLRN